MISGKHYDGFIWSGFILFAPVLYSLFVNQLFPSADIRVSLWILGNIILACLCILYLKKNNQMELFYLKRPKLSKFVWMILSYLILLLWTIASSRILPVSQNNQLLEKVAMSSSYLQFLIPFMVMVVAPIYEEIIIRALPMQLLKPYTKYGLDIIVASVLFACAHLHGLVLSDFISYFVSGLIYAILVRKTKSIYYSMGLHFMWNGFGYLLFLLVKIL